MTRLSPPSTHDSNEPSLGRLPASPDRRVLVELVPSARVRGLFAIALQRPLPPVPVPKPEPAPEPPTEAQPAPAVGDLRRARREALTARRALEAQYPPRGAGHDPGLRMGEPPPAAECVALRLAAGFVSQREAAAASGVSRGLIGELERKRGPRSFGLASVQYVELLRKRAEQPAPGDAP